MASETACQIALKQHEEELSRYRNVVGLGIVSASDEVADANSAVGVYVKKKLPEARLSPAELLPKSLSVKVGTRKVQVPVKVIEQGTVRLEEREAL